MTHPALIANRERRSGLALLLALAAVVVAGVLVTGSLFVSAQRNRIGIARAEYARVLTGADVAEAQAFLQLSAWNVDSLIVGESTAPVNMVVGPKTSAVVTVTRLAPNIFQLSTEATTSSRNTRDLVRRTGLLFTLAAFHDSMGVVDTTMRVPMLVRERPWVVER